MTTRYAVIGLTLLTLLGTGSASGQSCPLNGTSSSKLVCLIPQIYGPFGFGSTPNPSQSILFTGDHHSAHFSSDFLATFQPINEAVGLQVSELPVASPSSGISFVFDTKLGTFEPSTNESLGPILGERATTIGKRKLFVGFSYQYFSFSSIDGRDMNDIPTVLQHQPFLATGTLPACSNQTSLTTTNGYAGDPCFVRDYIQTTNDIDLTVHQYTIYVTYGITSRLDVSAAIPILNVHMTVASQAGIVPNSVVPASVGAPGNVWHSFNASNPVLMAQCASQNPCLDATFRDSGSATGIGDVILRGKYTVIKRERLAIAAGVDVRLPTGDALNFLGSGATGVKPFGVVSYAARVSPHAEVGYEVNGSSRLAGTNIVPAPPGTTPINTAGLPNRLIYIVGADVRVMKRLTAAFDLYGQRLFDSPELVSQPYQGLGSCSGPTNTAGDCPVYTPGTIQPNIAQGTANIEINDASLGLKYRAVGKLVLTGNVLLKLDSGGLRSKAVPLVGVSYNF